MPIIDPNIQEWKIFEKTLRENSIELSLAQCIENNRARPIDIQCDICQIIVVNIHEIPCNWFIGRIAIKSIDYHGDLSNLQVTHANETKYLVPTPVFCPSCKEKMRHLLNNSD